MNYRHPEWRTDDDDYIRDLYFQLDFFSDMYSKYSFNPKIRSKVGEIKGWILSLIRQAEEEYAETHHALPR